MFLFTERNIIPRVFASQLLVINTAKHSFLTNYMTEQFERNDFFFFKKRPVYQISRQQQITFRSPGQLT